jgi:serine O-acetyltransferase
VIIYAQAVILGGETRIGHNSIIGGNVWLTKSVPPYSLVVHHDEIRFREVEPYVISNSIERPAHESMHHS